MNYQLGYIRDPKDSRDLVYGAVVHAPESKVIDYSLDFPDVRHQGNRGSCVAFGFCAILEWQHRMREKWWMQEVDLSEEMLYRQIAEPGGGSFPRNACKALATLGTCRESLWRYSLSESDPTSTRYMVDWREKRRALGDAKKWKIAQYLVLPYKAGMIESLRRNGPFFMGLSWDRSWFEVGDSNILSDPQRRRTVGGHGFCVVGYDGEIDIWKIRNQWGRGWGNGGYAWITHEAVMKNDARCWAVYDRAL